MLYSPAGFKYYLDRPLGLPAGCPIAFEGRVVKESKETAGQIRVLGEVKLNAGIGVTRLISAHFPDMPPGHYQDYLSRVTNPWTDDPKVGRIRTKARIESLEQIAEYLHEVGKAGGSDVSELCPGFPPRLWENLVKEYKNKAADVVRKDPYYFVHPGGLKLWQADIIWKANGGNPEDKKRICGIYSATMDIFKATGDTVVEHDSFVETAKKISQTKSFPEAITMSDPLNLDSSRPNWLVINDDNSITEKSLFLAEHWIANDVIRLNRSKKLLARSDKELEDTISDVERELGIAYDPEQRKKKAVLSRIGGVDVITGGPGTGKTTILRGILLGWEKLGGSEVALCAPTGRAAQRMTEATGHEASTVHRLCGLKPFATYEETRSAAVSRDEPIEADFVIVDEASMLDSIVASRLLSGIKSKRKLLIMGDADQLESVAPGAVLRDIIESGKIPVHRLATVHRQGEGSLIIENAGKVLSGDIYLTDGPDFRIMESRTPEDTRRAVKQVALDDPDHTQVLCPVKGGASGCNALNALLQEERNWGGCKLFRTYGVQYRAGDPIIFTVNNPADGYMNGDLAILVEADDPNDNPFAVMDDGSKIEITKERREDIALAYCLTVHKSQGSEFDHVVLVLPEWNL